MPPQAHASRVNAKRTAAMTTYNVDGDYQWNFMNSSSQTLQVQLAQEIVFDLDNICFGSKVSGVVVATLYNQVLSYWECGDNSLTPVASYNYYGGTEIELPPGYTLTLAGCEPGNECYYRYDESDQPTILVNGQWALLDYSQNDSCRAFAKQYVNIVGDNGFTVTVNTDTQNNVTGNGVEIQNGGAGGPLNADNMCFHISDTGATQVGTDQPDTLLGSSLNDILTGYNSADSLYGKAGIDYLVGGGGGDLLDGGDGRDILIGNEGRDRLLGGEGDDALRGGPGADQLDGGQGMNTFYWESPSDGGDTIIGFKPKQNSLQISAEGFGGGLKAGTPLAKQQFISSPFGPYGFYLFGGTSGDSSSGLFIYNAITGMLLFDRNGIPGGADSSVVATFAGAPTLTASDIAVVA